MSQRESLPDHSERDSYPVGEGPDYEAIRAAARELVPLFDAGWPRATPSTNHWGAGLIDMLEPAEGGHKATLVYPVASAWEKRSNSITRTVDLGMVRVTGIALLAYAEAHDSATSDEERQSS